MEFIKPFHQLSKSDAAIAGGKGASLGEMTSAGLAVPPGFVVLSAGFEKFLAETDLNVEIDSILHSVNQKEMHTVENASAKIKDLILKARMPKDISQEIKKEFKKLNSEFVAVRSSATAEDSSSAAWAGQLDSFLNTTEETLLANVQKCWASLFTPRAIFYRFEKGLHNSKISVAVVIQKMIESEVSGIAFSVHPVTEDHNQLIIEAGYGLGEAIVSGQITPDSYVVEKEPRRIIDKNISIQERGIYRKLKDGGNEWQNIPPKKGQRQKLTDEQILELSELIIQIENHYGFPVDIEWAYESDKFYITQSRPITTLKAKDKQGEKNLIDKFIALSRNQETSPPIRNLSIFAQTLGWNTEGYYNKYYSDETPFSLFLTVNKNEQVLLMQLDKAKKLSREIFKEYWNNKKSFSIIIKAHEDNKKEIEAFYRKLTYDSVQSKSEEQLINFASISRDLFCESVAITLFARDFDKEICLQLLEEVGSNISLSRLNQLWDKGVIPICRSFETRRLFYLAELLKKNKSWDEISESCQFFEANYNKFLTLEESEKMLKNKFNSLIKNPRKELISIRKQEKNIILEYKKWFSALLGEEKMLFNFIQTIIRLRDERKDLLAKSSLIIFKIAQNFFKKADVSENLIYFYRVDELLNGTNYLQHNKIELKNRLNGYSVLVNYNGLIEEEYNSFNQTKNKLEKFYFRRQEKILGNKVIGQTGSPGKVQGVAKVIMNISKEKDKFIEGDILVTGMTRPEFVHLMKKSSAIITDEGGITSHAAIISRELKKPCIIGTKIATQVLHDGDLVEVDADKGVVRIMERAK